MRFARTKAVLVGLALATDRSLGGSAGSDDGGGADVEVKEDAAASFDDGTRMKELADAGKITIGVKFDQPGIGFKGAGDDTPDGLRRRDGARSSPAPSASVRATSPGRRRSPTTASRSCRTARSTW